MSNNLIYVLAKVQFGHVTDSRFNKCADAVRDGLRQEYPVFISNKELRQVEIRVSPEGQESKETVIPMIVQISASRNWGVRIAPNHLFLHTNQYESFDDFNDRLSHVLSVVGPSLSILHTEFVGIRYINKFKYDEDSGFAHVFRRNEFLQPKMNNMVMSGSNLSSRYKTDVGWLNINSGVLVNQAKLPNEIMELASDFGVENEILEGPWAHLDVDSYSSENGAVDYDHDGIIGKLKSLRGYSKDAYEQIIFEAES